MSARWSRLLLGAALLVAAAVVGLTGLVADRLDAAGLAVHRWAGFALLALVLVDLVVHGRLLHAARTRTHRMHAAAADSEPAESASPLDGFSVSRRAALVTGLAGIFGGAAGWLVKAAVSPTPYPGGGDVGLFYHRESSLGVRALVRGIADWGRRPPPYERRGAQPAQPLPPFIASEVTVGHALAARRSLRTYQDRDLTGAELAWLVHAATGITSADGHRTAPSAGALYPIELYVAVRRVAGINPGLYHVDVRAQALEMVRQGSVADDVASAALGQGFLREAPVVLAFTGLFQRTRWKYHERHYRYACWEGGHIAQNVYLAAEAAGLGACMVGGFVDGRLNELLSVDGRREAALGLMAVGPR